jgi:ABC-type transport system involved in cytochrome c biogenesis permease subunit
VLLPLVYLILVVVYGALFLTRHSLLDRAATPLLWLTLGIHLVHLIALGKQWGQMPAATVPQALALVAFAVALVYAIVEWLGRDRSTGVWILSLVFVLQVLASVLERPDPPELHLFRSPLFSIHIGSALLGYAAFVVAGGYGFLFLALYRELKSGTFRLFYGRLPPLETLDRMTSGALTVGFVGLSVAVVAGLLWALKIDYRGWLRDTKILLTLATWCLYGAALLLRRLQHWQGRQTALASIAGLLVILLSLLISNFLGQGLHPL